MTATQQLVEAGRLLGLAGGLALTAWIDLRNREIDDRLWQGLGLWGALLGAFVEGTGSEIALLVWLLVAAFALEHLFPWDEALGKHGERYLGLIEVAIYLAVLIVVASAVARFGLGPGKVPLAAIALLATVILARGLFELGILYGGADAKAVIVVGLLVPLLASPLLVPPAAASPVLAILPFSITMLTNAAVFSLVVPLSVAVRNVRRGEFSFPAGFTGYSLPVELLPYRFVWVRDPVLGEDGLSEDVETSAEDQQRRRELAVSLAHKGVRRVWVSPQIPFVVLLALGAFAGILAGNVLLDLLALI